MVIAWVSFCNSSLIWIVYYVERLHDELSENHHIYTDHVNGLHLTISKLEKRVEELQVEISTIQEDYREKAAALKEEKKQLQSEIDSLKNDIKE